MHFRLHLVIALFGAATVVLAACSDDGKPCDPDKVLINRVCKPKPADLADASTEDVTEPDPDAEVEDVVGTKDTPAVPMDVAFAFGRDCTMSGDAAVECGGTANFCATKPSTPNAGYCTVLGCKDTPSLCPMGWSCFDVGVTNFCAKP
jgi:hypothetical protein